MVRPADLGCGPAETAHLAHPAIERFIAEGKTPEAMAAAAALLPDALTRHTVERTGLDETMEMVRAVREVASTRIKPHAHGWHLRNEYIPMDVVSEMAELGVFGLTIRKSSAASAWQDGDVRCPRSFRALYRHRLAWHAVEIAAELILIGGTPEQKDKWLPAIAPEKLPTAVFTGFTGSDSARCAHAP